MIAITSPTIEGHPIATRHGVVTGKTAPRANIRLGITGGRPGADKADLGDARRMAMPEMKGCARAAGGNATVGTDLDDEVMNNMLMVSASGPAATIE